MTLYKKRRYISITKYNPIYRNDLGHFKNDEWTSYSDIGIIYNGTLFLKDEYEKVESLYIMAVFLILNFFNSKSIKITHMLKLSTKKDFIKNGDLHLYKFFKEIANGEKIQDTQTIMSLIKLRLREYIVELELTVDNKSRSEIIFGFDYYMYLKTNKDVSLLSQKIIEIGLFCE